MYTSYTYNVHWLVIIIVHVTGFILFHTVTPELPIWKCIRFKRIVSEKCLELMNINELKYYGLMLCDHSLTVVILSARFIWHVFIAHNLYRIKHMTARACVLQEHWTELVLNSTVLIILNLSVYKQLNQLKRNLFITNYVHFRTISVQCPIHC